MLGNGEKGGKALKAAAETGIVETCKGMFEKMMDSMEKGDISGFEETRYDLTMYASRIADLACFIDTMGLESRAPVYWDTICRHDLVRQTDTMESVLALFGSHPHNWLSITKMGTQSGEGPGA